MSQSSQNTGKKPKKLAKSHLNNESYSEAEKVTPQEQGNAKTKGSFCQVSLIMIIFALFCGGLSTLVYGWVAGPLPFAWAEPLADYKMAQLQGSYKDATFVAVGSSRVLNGFSPSAFDSLLKSKGIASKSFNLGVYGMFNPEAFEIAEQVLAEKDSMPELKTMLIELTASRPPQIENMNTTRVKGWRSWNAFKWSIAEVAHGQVYTITKRIGYVGRFLLAGAIRIWNFGLTSEALDRRLKGRPNFHEKGQFMLAGHWNDAARTKFNEYKVSRNEDPLADERPDPVPLKTLERVGRQSLDKKYEVDNPELLKRAKDLIAKGKAQNVRVVFAIWPRLEEYEIRGVRQVLNALPTESKFEAHAIPEHTDLYTPQTSRDAKHLNDLGSRIYSIKFANYFTSINN